MQHINQPAGTLHGSVSSFSVSFLELSVVVSLSLLTVVSLSLLAVVLIIGGGLVRVAERKHKEKITTRKHG